VRLLKTFCLAFALLLVLGHQLVPHIHGHAAVHGDGLFAAQHQAELPWWMQLFSLDQGAEHLEHFRQNRESAAETADLLDIPLPLIPASILWLAPTVSIQAVCTERPLLPVARGFAAQHGLRGPPQA
jgi:hypothetical protein